MAKTWWEHPDGDLNEEEREKEQKDGLMLVL